MPIRVAAEPSGDLYRIGRPPDPLAWPPRALVGGGRYDDPDGRFTVLYAAEQRRGAFVETLDAFRPAIADLVLVQNLPAGDLGDRMPAAGIIPEAYLRRLIGRFRLTPGQRWLDLRAPQTHQVLRRLLAPTLLALGYAGRFVWGDVLGHDHALTQAIAGWTYDNGYHGIVYSSCHDPRLDCWAIFEGAAIVPIGAAEAIVPDDPDLIAVRELFELSIGDERFR